MQNTKGVRTVGQSTGLPKEGSVTSIFINASTQPPLPSITVQMTGYIPAVLSAVQAILSPLG